MSKAIKQYIESKEGLKDRCRSRWVAGANVYHARCISDGGTPDECDAKTIRMGERVTNLLVKLVKVKRAKRLLAKGLR